MNEVKRYECSICKTIYSDINMTSYMQTPPGNVNRVVQLNIPGVWLNGITRL